jgi:hypothetical protein
MKAIRLLFILLGLGGLGGCYIDPGPPSYGGYYPGEGRYQGEYRDYDRRATEDESAWLLRTSGRPCGCITDGPAEQCWGKRAVQDTPRAGQSLASVASHQYACNDQSSLAPLWT